MTDDRAIVCVAVRKRFGRTAALDGLDLAVPYGVVHGLLGPNGAGKTTAVRVLTTLLHPDAGRAEVAGHDVVAHPAQVRARIGLVGQHPAVDEVLSGRQNLELFGRLYHLGAGAARGRAGELLEMFGLAEAGTKPVRRYSGGMRRRLDLAASFIVAPAVLFLDEPTAGLDPHSRALVWHSIRDLVHRGTTILLTTQYLDEADQLAGTVTILDRGRAIAQGSPDQLKSRIGGDRIDIVLRRPDDLPAAAALVRGWLTAEPETDPDRRRLNGPVANRVEALTGIARILQDRGIDCADIAVRRPTLDEAFLHLTNRSTGGAAPARAPEVRV